jgi:bla regulator protein blaR1
MLQKLKPVAGMAIVLICFTGIAGIAWKKTPAPISGDHHRQDTIPKKKHANTDETILNGDLNRAMEDIKKAQENLNQQQNKDWGKIQKELLKAQAALNVENIQEQIENATKNIDLQKIEVETQAALQKVNWEKMQQEMQKAQAEIKNNIDSKKLDAEISRAMEQSKKALAELKAVDMEKIQSQLEKAKAEMTLNEGRMQADIENAKKAINENLHKDIKRELEKAAEQVNRASEELQNYRNMLDEMDKDGLLHADGPYDIEYKNGKLSIDGKLQPAAVTDKYKHYFKKEKVTLKRGKDDEDNDKIIHL